MELNPVTSLEWLDWDIISRLGVAAILGLVLGLDREWRGHAAGMRTHGLICVSAAAMVVSLMAYTTSSTGRGWTPCDCSRQPERSSG
jgi:putative Mg2+ transporter-C (MgtC) family protein